ncbi:hypothetical protein QBB34_34070 [Streptomyces stelliscabiei]|uniref:hypothetical protein n=1 Tax=Streptomyces stelliscabiei TaxID=146820 RepID=UPI002FF067D0
MPELSTADHLTRFHAELRAGGLSQELADDLVRDANRVLVAEYGLLTKPIPSSVIEISSPSEVFKGVGESKSPA